MSGADEQLAALFRDEANERLDHMVETALALERGDAPADAVAALFRDAHTIKGGAGMLGLDRIVAIAHALEDVLQRARTAGELPREEIQPLLEAVDRMRAELDGRPEPEPVREPAPAASQTVRVSHEKIDRLLEVVGESLLHHRRLEHLSAPGVEIDDELLRGERLLDELKDSAIAMRTLPLGSIVSSLPRAVRDIARSEGKQAELHVSGAEIELDRTILETLAEPLAHLLRNAVAHGIESSDERALAGKPATGRIELRATQRGAFVEVVVADDGRGVAQSVLAEARGGASLADLLARPGFSTAESAGDLAGRGVGLDAVKRHVEGFGGTLEVRSEPGRGTEIALMLPLALALLDVILVERGGRVFGVPLSTVEEVTQARDVVALQGRRSLVLRGAAVPLVDLADVVGADAPALGIAPTAVVVANGVRRRAIACDALLGTAEVVVKPLPLLGRVPGHLGAAIRGDGTIALLLDPSWLVHAHESAGGRAIVAEEPAAALPQQTVLVVEDSFSVRELQRSILEAAGYAVDTAQDGQAALARLTANPAISLVVSDVEMPNLDGFGLTRAIRADARRASLPVVLVTSLDSDEHRRRGLEAGADAYIAKNAFDQRGLLETIDRLVGV